MGDRPLFTEHIDGVTVIVERVDIPAAMAVITWTQVYLGGGPAIVITEKSDREPPYSEVCHSSGGAHYSAWASAEGRDLDRLIFGLYVELTTLYNLPPNAVAAALGTLPEARAAAIHAMGEEFLIVDRSPPLAAGE
ncbi:MAG: hypothetical protein AAFV59_16470 [Pseudomonadota bacterium]